MTEQQKILQYREFTSVLLTCQLAVEFNKSKPNKAIKHALKRMQPRLESDNIKLICSHGMKSIYPSGWLARQISNIQRGGMSADEFLKVGAEI